MTSLGRAPKLIPPKSLLATFEDAGHPIDGEPGAVQEKHGGSDEDTLGPGGEPDAGGDWLFAVFA